MKRIGQISSIILCVLGGCCGDKQSTIQSGDFLTVDVTKTNYPKKELILQDFMDVEYIPLETTDEFVCQGLVKDIGEKFIVVVNRNDDGNIFIFDKKGKAVKKINRKGQGGEEYTYFLGIVLDEENEELFVNEHLARRIRVYDIDGNFKRSLKHEGAAIYTKVFNFDRGNLICWDGSINVQSFSIISKQDGSIIRDIKIPFQERVLTSVILKDEANKRSYSSRAHQEAIIPYYNSFILTEASSDTVYKYMPNHNMTPFIVRTPSIQSMNPKVFLFPTMITDPYYFMDVVKKEYDFATQQGFPSVSLMYDKKDKALFRYTVYNDDYLTK